ncbi:MAG: cytochrome P450 [Solirubrobacteraceae bacterium]
MLRAETAVDAPPTELAVPPAVDGVPSGPGFPLPLQTLAMMTRQRAFLGRARRRFGPLFTIRVFGLGTLVLVAEPELIKQTFQADPRTLHAGTGSPLRRILGPNSMLGIDEDQHMEHRRLLLPPFKGQRMRTYEPLIAEIASAEIDTWPSGVEFATSKSMQRITLRAILRALFGAEGDRLEQLERLVPPWTTLGSRLATMTFLQHDLGQRSPWRRFLELRRSIDVILDELIAVAKADPDLEERPDVLALMVLARHGDGQPMSNPEIRDELVTMIAAGHETTAHTLSWAIDRLRRHPELLRRLVEEADAGGKALREATIREVQRVRPVISFAGRFVREPYELGGYRLPIGTRVLLAANLTHTDPALFPHPERFDPDRFLGVVPDTYAWIPFGGGRRRCIGATFAHMELDVVLRTILQRVELQPTTEPGERWTFRGVAWGPADGGRARVTRRTLTPRRAIAA